jgi:proteasome accessory factor A
VKQRMFGLETEYAIAPRDPAGPVADRRAMSAWLLERMRKATPSVRDSAGHGVFLVNAGRVYLDAGHHLEAATPELSNPWDAVRYVLAGERIVQQVAATGEGVPPGWAGSLVLKTNVDYECHTTWGTHESFLASRATDVNRLAAHLVPHLVSRVLYTGAGGWNPFSPGLQFVLSPRALFMVAGVSPSTTHDRGIFCTKDESLADHQYRRLHLVCGESLNSHTGMWLRTATTALIIALIEGGVDAGSRVLLAKPVEALAAIAMDPSGHAAVPVEGGSTMTALDIQRCYLARVEENVQADFMPPWAPEACRHWRAVLDRVGQGPGAVAATLDWAIKRRSLQDWASRRRGFDWAEIEAWTGLLNEACGRLGDFFEDQSTAPAKLFRAGAFADSQARDRWESLVASRGLRLDRLEPFFALRAELCEADVRFGQVGDDGLFATLDRAGVLEHRFPGVDNVEHAVENPPASGRARVRGEVIRRLIDRRDDISCDWNVIRDGREKAEMVLSDPRGDAEGEWLPMRVGHRETLIEPLLGGCGSETDTSRVGRRCRAHDCYERGDYTQAEELLRHLMGEGYQLASTRCHLARVLVMQDRLDEARAEVELAWSARGGGPEYAVGRLLWFRALFAALAASDLTMPLGRLKAELARTSVREPWTMGPVMARLAPRLAEPLHGLFTLLTWVLAGHTSVVELDAWEVWRRCEPVAAE